MTQLTILNDIVHQNLELSLQIQKSWKIETVDLRNINGKSLIKLSDDEAKHAAEAVRQHGMTVYCLSFGLFFDDIEKGEAYFRENHLGQIARMIELAQLFRPKVVRILSAHSTKRESFVNSIEYMREQHPWVIPMYREAIDQLSSAGVNVTLENEVLGNIFTTSQEIIRFFEELDRRDKVSFTFDVQNLWLMGTFPTMEFYRKLKPLIGYYHLKGGMSDSAGSRLKWKSNLADASWPVLEMTRDVVMSGICEAICLNPSHGEEMQGYHYDSTYHLNVGYLRKHIPQLL